MDHKIHFSWTMVPTSNDPIYIRLYQYIKEEIVAGNFPAGAKLPSIREATGVLNISKTTVENAYNQLTVEGYIENQPKRGYYVAGISEYRYSSELIHTTDQSEEPSNDEINYTNNAVDSESFDVNLWRKLYNRVVTDATTKICYSGSIQGEYALRTEISEFVNHLRGGQTTPAQIVVGAGTQYLLGILTGILHGSHNTIAMEMPGYKKAEYVFEDHNFSIRHIPVAKDGVSVERLRACDARFIYVSPSHQYPLGSAMPINKRMELLNWANESGGLIIEDDYDGIIRYDGMPIPCLQGLDKNDCVIYLGSFSKTLLPALRISFMILPHRLLPDYQQIKYRYTQSTSKIDQLVLASFIREGYMTKHLRKIRRIYKRKNMLILNYINRHYKDELNIVNADSGFHMACEASSTRSDAEIYADCREKKIFIDLIERSYTKILFSINYSGIPDGEIPSFIDRLAEIFTLS